MESEAPWGKGAKHSIGPLLTGVSDQDSLEKGKGGAEVGNVRIGHGVSVMNSGTTTSFFFFCSLFSCCFFDPAHLSGRVSVIVHRLRASCTYFPSALSMATSDG